MKVYAVAFICIALVGLVQSNTIKYPDNDRIDDEVTEFLSALLTEDVTDRKLDEVKAASNVITSDEVQREFDEKLASAESQLINPDGTKDPAEINEYDIEHGHPPHLRNGTHLSHGDEALTDAQERMYFGTSSDQDDETNDEKADNERRNAGWFNRWLLPIPYEIDSSLGRSGRDAIKYAIDAFRNSGTCVDFRLKVPTDKYFITFYRGNGCVSELGAREGGQRISLGPGCEYKSTVIHEVLHAFGFFHEQSRPDRDNYIRVAYENIIPGMETQYKKLISSEVYGQPYDYRSVMHYTKKSMSKNGRDVLTATTNNDVPREFGQHAVIGGFSKYDVIQVNKMFRCGTPEERRAAKVEITPTIQGCAFSAGHRMSKASNGDISIPSIRSHSQCVQACIEKRKLFSTVNGVTFNRATSGNPFASCFCIKDIADENYIISNFESCRLPPVAPVAPVVPVVSPVEGCTFVPGFARAKQVRSASASYIHIDDSPNTNDCVRRCVEKRKSNPSIDAIITQPIRGNHKYLASCICIVNVEEVLPSGDNYQSCRLPPIKGDALL